MNTKQEMEFCKSEKAKEMAYKIASFYKKKREMFSDKPLQGTYRHDAYPLVFNIEEWCMKCGFLRIFVYENELDDIDDITIQEQLEYGFIYIIK